MLGFWGSFREFLGVGSCGGGGVDFSDLWSLGFQIDNNKYTCNNALYMIIAVFGLGSNGR